MERTASMSTVDGPIQIPLKEKYRPYEGDYFAKKCGINGDHKRRKKRTKTGPKTYDKRKHVLVVQANGKARMKHSE